MTRRHSRVLHRRRVLQGAAAQLPTATQQVASESWVLGKQAEVDPNSPQVLNLQHDVVALYTNDYAKQWDALLNDLDVQPLTNLQQAVQDLYVLSSPQSPMRDLLAGITRQLTLTQPPPPAARRCRCGGGCGAGRHRRRVAGGRLPAAALQGLFGQTNGPPPEPPGKAIETRYAALIAFVGSGPGAPIDNALKLLNDLQQQLAQVANAGRAARPQPGGGDDPAQMLQAEASRDPQPVRRWLVGPGDQRQPATQRAERRTAAAAAFNAPGGPASLCKPGGQRALSVHRRATNGIPLDDFGRLFAAGGMINKFFNAQLGLRRYLRRRSGRRNRWPASRRRSRRATWRSSSARRRSASCSSPAAAISRPCGSTSRRRDTDAKQVTLELDGQTIVYAHGPLRATSVTWPGANRMNSVRLVFDPPPSSGPPVMSGDRAVGAVPAVRPGHAATGQLVRSLHADLHAGDRSASFEIRAGSRCSTRLPPAYCAISGARASDPCVLPGGGAWEGRQAWASTASCRRAAISCAGPAARLHRPLGRLARHGDRRQPRADGRGLAARVPGSAGLALHLAAGMCGSAPALGLMLPSVDRAGRYFPLTFAALLPPHAALRRRGARPRRGSTLARPLDALRWNAIRRHRRSLTRWVQPDLPDDTRNLPMASGGARVPPRVKPCALMLALFAGCGNLCGDAGGGRSFRRRRNSRFRGRPHGSPPS